MSFRHDFATRWISGINSVDGTYYVENNSEENTDVDVPGDTGAGANTVDVDIAFLVAKVTSIFIHTDKDVGLYSNGSPTGDAFAMKAGTWIEWLKDSGVPCPFTVYVDTLSVENGNPDVDDAGRATVKIRITVDNTL